MPKNLKKGTKFFFISFILSFVVLMCIFLTFFLFGSFEVSKPINKVEEKVPYISKPQENMNILVLGCEKTEMTPNLMLLLRYDAVNSKITIVPLESETAVNIGVEKTTLLKQYDYGGINACVTAVENLLLCDIDRYVRINSIGIANMIDYLGGIEFEFNEGIICNDITFTRGKQLLDGRRVAAIMCEEKQTKLKGEVLNEYFSQHYNETLDYNKLVSVLFYNVETNLNQYDFALRQKGFIQALTNSSLSIETMNINGVYTDEFTPDSDSLDNVINMLNLKD